MYISEKICLYTHTYIFKSKPHPQNVRKIKRPWSQAHRPYRMPELRSSGTYFK